MYALGLCLLVALVDESLRSMVPGREGRVQDVALDLGAAGLMALLAKIYTLAVKRCNRRR
jgi:VanZ family protein